MEPIELDLQESAASGDRPAGVVTNVLWMFLSQGVTIAINGAISIWAIRSIDPSRWGQYSTAFALSAVFNVLSGLGIAQLALREMSQAPGRRREIFAQAMTAEFATTAVALPAMAVTAYLLHYPRVELIVLALIAPTLLLEPVLSLCYAAFNAAQRLVLASAFQLARVLVYGVLGALVLLLHPDVVWLAAALLVAGVAALVVSLVLLDRELGIRPRIAASGIRPFVIAAVPVAGVSIVGIVYDRVDTLMLSGLANASEVAHYTVPYGWIRLSWVVPSIIAGVFFPVLARGLAEDRDRTRDQFFVVVRVFLFLSLPLSLLLAVGSPTLVEGVFGAKYHASVSVLSIFAWTSVLGFENYVLWWAILAIHRERLVLWIQTAGLALNVAVNAILIPRYGADGAAIALLASDFFVVAGQAVVVHRRLFRLPLARLMAKPAAAAVVAIPAAFGLARVQPLLGAGLGAVVYAALLLLTGYISREEWQPLTAGPQRAALRLFRRAPSAARS